jgi:hypothetical protein
VRRVLESISERIQTTQHLFVPRSSAGNVCHFSLPWTATELENVRKREPPGVHVYCLSEDLRIQVIQRFRSSREWLRLDILSSQLQEAQDIIEAGFARQHRWGPVEAIREHLERIVSDISFYGVSWHELSINCDERSFRVITLLPGTIRATPFGVWQTIAQDDGTKRSAKIPRRVLRCVSSGIMSPRRWASMILQLSATELATMPSWMPENIATGNIPYPPAEHRRSADEEFLVITNLLQYPPRNFGYKQGVSPVLASYRTLRFRAFCSRLRDRLVEEVNHVLSQVGASIGFSATARVVGTVSAETYEQAAGELLEGVDHELIVRRIRELESQAAS